MAGMPARPHGPGVRRALARGLGMGAPLLLLVVGGVPLAAAAAAPAADGHGGGHGHAAHDVIDGAHAAHDTSYQVILFLMLTLVRAARGAGAGSWARATPQPALTRTPDTHHPPTRRFSAR